MALPWDAWLNIDADQFACMYLDQTWDWVGPLEYHIPGSQWVCYLAQHRAVKQLMEKLQEHINGLVAIHYWKQCHKILDNIWDSIDWDALAMAYKEVSSTKQ